MHSDTGLSPRAIRGVGLAAPVMALLGLAGCSHRPIPGYVAPTPATPSRYTASLTEGLEAGEGMIAAWWSSFGDPVLEGLVRRGLAGNLDLEVALTRLQEARGLRGEATQGLAPSVDATGSYARRRHSARTPTGALLPRYVDDLGFGVEVGWELDVWGRVRAGVRARDARVGARLEDARAALVLVVAEIGTAYIEVREAQERLRIASANAGLQEETLRLTRSRFSAGLVSELDVSQAASLLAETRAAVPSLELAAQRARNRLAVLVGDAPGSLEGELATPGPIPLPPHRVEVGIPADLVRRRPDLRGAERELAAVSAELGVARADLFPRFTLGGFLGFQAQRLGDLLTDPARAFGLGPVALWKLFNRRQLRGRIRAAGARVDLARITYERAVLLALEEAENAILAVARHRQRLEQLEQATAHAGSAVELSRNQYREGLVGFQSVLDSQGRLFALEDAEAVARAANAEALVTLYKSLGGGWQDREVAPPSPASPSKENR